MAASGFTPIQLYRTSTAAAVPVDTNLTDGELAINTTDEKLYFKNAAGTVKLLASNAAATGGVTAVSVVSANGLAGSSSGGATPALTLSTSITGVLKGNGTAISAAVAGTDYVTPTGTETLTNKDLTSGTNTFPTSLATLTGAETLTNKRINPRVVSAASASSLTPSVATADQYAYTALAAGLTINAPTGTPVDGNKLIFRFLDNGTARALTWNATYTVIGVTLPTTTTLGKMLYVGCIYNAANIRWDVIAVTTQA